MGQFVQNRYIPVHMEISLPLRWMPCFFSHHDQANAIMNYSQYCRFENMHPISSQLKGKETAFAVVKPTVKGSHCREVQGFTKKNKLLSVA